MKKVFSIVFLIACFNLFGQKQFEATDKKSGQATTILEGSRVKLTTQDRSQMLIKNAETLTIEGQEVALKNISSIKNYPHGGRKSKNGSTLALFTGGTNGCISQQQA
ncbi:hypothetical protein BWK63_06080 [Flavobacterium covae]|uniref:OstA-like protein n=1 Tax=Flavobacterium covae TaxID=2906076 RepID=A0ABW8PJ12_9FLAO|nr:MULTISPECIES: hypothetical protein [Flavobacterium]OWP81421.1 hypothetical protein BWK63_06080 [Flavobacterium covae]POR21679.1 hypothetical protein BWK57_09200 [Flavobacterium columnare]